jgi:release factor glutamine methyltransferase
MNIGEYRYELKRILTEGCSEENAREIVEIADILLCHHLSVPRSRLYLKLEEDLPQNLAVEMADSLEQISIGVPVQYVMGSCWFYGREIKVGKGVFIPRADTEILAQAAIKAIPKDGCFADICSGSGCISVAIASERPDVRGFALELSRKAIPYTEENLSEFPSVTVKRFDALDTEDYEALVNANGKQFDLVVSNPPYIPTDDISGLDANVLSEPETALDGGEDGLRFYREITKNLPIILSPEGVICYEVGIGQAHDVSEILKSAGFSVAVLRDLHGIDRVVLGKKC